MQSYTFKDYRKYIWRDNYIEVAVTSNNFASEVERGDNTVDAINKWRQM